MNQNYCEIKKNKIYAEIYDELLDEELSMFNQEHNDKIKMYIEKKILDSKYINLSESFNSTEDIISDIILKITNDVSNDKLQGNTLLMYANDKEMYELFHMEDLTKSHSDDDLNEFGTITNIHLQPVYWGGGIFKTQYTNGKIKGDIITKKDISKLFIQNYYHKGLIIDIDGSFIELEFTGEDPFKVIGSNYSTPSQTDILGFSIVSYIEKTTDSTKINKKASKLLGKEITSRVFITLLCPTTKRKFWDITIQTINNLLEVLDNEEVVKEVTKDLAEDDMYINPFLSLSKFLNKVKKTK